jgi:Ca2+-binding RTX toxin-like protein
VAGLAGAAVLVAPGAAYAASSAGVSGATLRVDAEPGKANRFRLGMLNTTITITDSGDILTAGAGCVSITRNVTECDATSVTRIQINAGDGDDTVESQVLLDTTVNAGDGADLVTTSGRADTISGGGGADVLNGGAGDDTLNGGAGTDVLNGGANRDNLDGGTEADAFNGGADQDTADYDSRTVSVTVDLDGVADDGATGELDNVGVDVERILGGSAADTLTGSNLADVPNTLDGNQGSDTLIGLAGQDGLVGNEGDDTMLGGAGFDDFFPGAGQDDMTGGTERDEVFYSERTARVEVRLFDNLPNDGEVGEGDNARSDIEDAHTGAGPDVIIGTDNVNNNLTGGTGNDSLIDGRRTAAPRAPARPCARRP